MPAFEGASGGMTVRLAWAVLAALLLGGWLWQRCRSDNLAATPREERIAAGLRTLVLLLCGFWAVVWVVIALLRLPYPFELEWAGGEMRDTVERARAGLPLYVAPGPGWFPFEYPPLYFWVSALLMRVFGGTGYMPMRLVSVLSTLGCAWLLVLWVRRSIFVRIQASEAATGTDESRPHTLHNPHSTIQVATVWGVIAAGLLLASYRFTGAWYDIERLDMLFMFLSLLGVYALELAFPRRGAGWIAAAAAAFTLAFLTKQQAVLFIAGGAAALAWRRDGRGAALFSLLSVALCGGAVWALNRSTDGWFGYYCFRVPLANGVQAQLARQFFTGDLPLYMPILAMLAIRYGTRRRRRVGPGPAGQAATAGGGDSVLVCMTVMAVLGSLLSRAHWGGDQNVLIAAYLFLGAAACVAAGCGEIVCPPARIPLFALLLAQLLTLTYRPGAQIPLGRNRAAGERYRAAIQALEREGEVLCLDHGGFTTPRHFHLLGLMDVTNTQKGLPPALTAALRSHLYAAIVTDAKPTTGGALGEFLRDYPRIECVNLPETWVVTGFLSPDRSRRVWVLRPPLP